MIDRKALLKRLALAGYFLAAFLVFLFLLFPFERVKGKLESEFRQRTALELSVARLSPRFLNRFLLSDVVVSDQKGKVLFESRSTTAVVSLWNLLRGALALHLHADAYGGTLVVRVHQGKGQQTLIVDADNLDIASYSLLKDLGLHFAGKAGGNFEMSGDAGKGRVWVKGLTSRDLKVQGFPVPDLDFEQGWIEADVKGDHLTIKKLQLDGKQLQLRVTGDVILHERGLLNLTVKVKPSEQLAHDQSALISLLHNRDPEGFYQFSVGGLVSQPMPRL